MYKRQSSTSPGLPGQHETIAQELAHGARFDAVHLDVHEPEAASVGARDERVGPDAAHGAGRVALVRRSADGLTLAAGAMSKEGTLAPRDLLQLLSPPGTSHDPMIAGDAILVADDAAIPGEGRLRRVGVRWK